MPRQNELHWQKLTKSLGNFAQRWDRRPAARPAGTVRLSFRRPVRPRQHQASLGDVVA